jgi:hypothetical protein
MTPLTSPVRTNQWQAAPERPVKHYLALSAGACSFLAGEQMGTRPFLRCCNRAREEQSALSPA